MAGTGLLTLLIGSWQAIFQHDIQGLLPYSTISHLGLITLLLGLESPLTTVAAVFHMINHATFKASLFMAAGIIDHECGTRDMRRLHGLMKFLPWTGALAVIAAAAMAGVPLLNGFLSKEMFFAESLAVTRFGLLNEVVPLCALLAGMFGVAYSTRFIHDVFFGRALTQLAHEPHEPPRWMRWPVEVLVLLCIAVGSFPAWTIAGILDAAAVAAAGTPMPAYSLRLWHGFNLPLLMSGIAFVGGLALYFAIYRGGWLHRHETRALASAIFQRVMAGLTTLAQRARRATELDLSTQLRVLLLSALVLALSAALLSPLTWPAPELRIEAPWPAWLIAISVIVLTIAVVAMHRQRVRALVLLGAIGLLVSVSFALLSAPDLALTQLLVEVASVLLLLLALRRLPLKAPQEHDAARRGLDALIALGVGGGVALLCHRVLTQPAISISDYFLQQALPLAGGTNVVNVIIVDFRGLDTLGEMTVFAIAAIVVAGLLPRSTPSESGYAPLPESGHPLLLRTLATWLLPFALLISVYLLLRGHNQPGGGFIGGLTAAGAILLQILARGRAEFDRQLRWPWQGLLVSG
ncbi:MAG TPA: hydrogen gas-evolving membrane-bound hydrogenase subunit E, partial [Xanthomonadales bacterium]|nr:hydrogen gas-evolving membrane-bound hydrogenase subunit E [Xanthomonadales bacterium]